jgi:hypothetical protein
MRGGHNDALLLKENNYADMITEFLQGLDNKL